MGVARVPVAFAVFFAVGVPSVGHAQQQGSSAGGTLAQSLYDEGSALQQQGKFEEALQKYLGALAVYAAPTTALRIAECKVALGRLVEGAEDLRAVAATSLPAGSPEAFVNAKQQVVVELTSVESRIPMLAVDVIPPNAAGLTVTVDDQPLPAALLGAGHAVDPGTHTIVVHAPGYLQHRQIVDVQERQRPQVTVVLQSLSTGPRPAYGGRLPTPVTGVQYGASDPVTAGLFAAAAAASYAPPPNRFVLGVNLAFAFAAGEAPGLALDKVLGAGGAVGGEMGVRLAHYFYVGAMFQGSFFPGDSTTGYGTGVSVAADGVVGLMSNPENVGIYGELGGGYRSVSFTASNPFGTISGGDFLAGFGVQFKTGSFRFIPKLDVFVGAFGSSVHEFFTFGVSGYWEPPLSR